MTVLPSIFISHGSPMTALEETPARRFLEGLAAQVARPRAILCVSAHWESEQPTVSAAVSPETIHDFYGFPEPLYRLSYPAPGAPALAERVAALLTEAGLDCALDSDRGLDHGAWIPLLLAYPQADIPVTQLSIQHHLGPDHQLAVGRALAPLRREGVLILGSGALTHNLADVAQRRRQGRTEAPPPAWAVGFEAWVDERVKRGAVDELVDYRRLAPEAETAHPRDEHFLPLLTAAGAGGGGRGETLHSSFHLASLAMSAYAFGDT